LSIEHNALLLLLEGYLHTKFHTKFLA